MAAALAGAASALDFDAVGYVNGGMDFGVMDYSGTSEEVTGTPTQSTSTMNAPSLTALPGWNGTGTTRVGLGFEAKTDDGATGAHFDIFTDFRTYATKDQNGGAIVGDQAKVWTTLFDVVEVDFGKFYVDDLRGSIGDWNTRDVAWQGEDAVFNRFAPSFGMGLAIRPINGLFLGASIDASNGAATWPNAVRTIQAGLGYTVEDLVQVKAQWIGDTNAHGRYGNVQLGADLLMLPDNVIELGVKIPVQENSNNTDIIYAIVSMAGNAGDLEYKAQVYGDIDRLTSKITDPNDTSDDPKTLLSQTTDTQTNIGVGLGVIYHLGDFGVGAAAHYDITFAKYDKTNGLGIECDYMKHNIQAEIFAQKDIGSGGLFYVGLRDKLAISSFSASSNGFTLKGSATTNTLSIPVGMQVGF